MHTKDKLARALLEADLPEMAVRASEGYYDDYLSPIDMPIVTLANDLARVGSPAALALRARAMTGDFDATAAEAEAWAASPDGQQTFGRLRSK